jgi:hypothetical protein
MTGKPAIIASLGYKGPQRRGRGTGHQGLKATLKYLQFRDRNNNQLAQSHEYERWQDHGLGVHHREIYNDCNTLQSKHVLAWTWVISPAPDLMALVPEDQRRQLLYDLTERVVEDYYTERGFDVPEYSYVMHTAKTKPTGDEPAQEHLHTHVVLPGTAPSAADRLPVYNNATKGHDRLFREIASRDFAEALDQHIGIEWRRLREEPQPAKDDLSISHDDFFSL